MTPQGQDRIERRLAAILAADVAGYSRLMGADEAGTAKALRQHRAAIDPIVASHGGRIVKTTGDGVLLEFPSIVAAVECAMAVQKLMAERNAGIPEDRHMLFRVGINLGDVLIEGDDILGEGVNIAARLEGIAQPGGICISDIAYQQVQGKVSAQFIDVGEQQLKNIARPVRVYRLHAGEAAVGPRAALPLPDKPSIAILPFQNMSGDQEQEYFADGIVEEIITALSRFRQLFVIARNSSFTYKGRAIDVKQVGRELGVRYVLEGSVRKAGNRVRITGQLVDALTGAHLWADRFDGSLENIFDLQDQVTNSVVGQIAPKLEEAEIERAKRKPTERLDAYDYFLRGMASFHQFTREANAEALQLFYRAIELDPDFSSAYGMAAWCYLQRKEWGWVANRTQEIAEAARLARRAAELGRNDAVALSTGGLTLSFVVGELDEGAALVDRAVALNPNFAATWLRSGWQRVYLGEPEVAIDHLARAIRLSPFDPFTAIAQNGLAHAHFFADRYDDAFFWAQKAMQGRPNWRAGMRILAAAAALSGRSEEARQAIKRVRENDPTWRLSHVRKIRLFRRPEDLDKLEDGLRKAGLPE
jgi:TolB-like protein/class 3 adenylate cyclase/Tfp pilus assembly protein PilF